MASIVAVCVSERRGTRKHPVQVAEVTAGKGIEGDAHAGAWHRQVSVLAQESVQRLRKRTGMRFCPGDFAENILTEGIEPASLPVGTVLRFGEEVLGEVTQIGKECHTDCEIRRMTGECAMPREGIFLRILRGGTIRPGDAVAVARKGAGIQEKTLAAAGTRAAEKQPEQ